MLSQKVCTIRKSSLDFERPTAIMWRYERMSWAHDQGGCLWKLRETHRQASRRHRCAAEEF